MAMGGGGGANYQATFTINVAQAQKSLGALDKTLEKVLGGIQRTANTNVTQSIKAMDKAIINMAASTGNAAKTFQVTGKLGNALKVTSDTITASQKKQLNSTDRLRLKTIKYRESLSELKQTGKVTAVNIHKLADQLDRAAMGTGAARTAQLSKLSKGLRTVADDMGNTRKAAIISHKAAVAALSATQTQAAVQAQAATTPAPMTPVAAPRQTFTQRVAQRFQRGQTGTGPGATRRPNIKPDMVRGQAMPERTREAAEGLLKMGSAAQGTMIGLAALQGNVTSLAFGLIFLSYGLIGVAAAAAAVTIAFTVVARTLVSITSQALEAGRAFESSGQQMANWFQSGELAMKFKAENIQIAKTFGITIDAVDKVSFALQKVGLKGDIYTKAVLNASAAGNGTPEEIAGRLASLSSVKTRPESRARLVEQFAQDMNIPIKQYSSSIEIAEALNKRFANSASAAAKTTEGAIQTMKNTWQEFVINVGVLLNEYLKPIVEVTSQFFQGFVDGFKEAFKADAATGKLKTTVEGLQNSVRKLGPYLQAIGAVLGRVIYKMAILAAQGLKVLADVMQASLKWAKAHKDEFKAAGTSFKQNFLDVIVGAPAILRTALVGLEAFGASLIKSFRPKIVLDAAGIEIDANAGKNILTRIAEAIKGAPKSLLNGIWQGLKAGLIFALIETLALTAVDLLPVSDNIKEQLGGAVRLAFTVGALAMVFGPIGVIAGLAIGAAVAAGLELIAPGISATISDWIDKYVGKALGAAGVFITKELVPALKAGGAAINSWAKEDALPAMQDFQNYVQTSVVPATKSWASATSDFLMPKLKDLGSWTKNEGVPGLISLGATMGGGTLDAAKRFGSYLGEKLGPLWGALSTLLNEKLGPSLKDLGGWLDNNVMPGVTAVGNFLKDHLIPAFITLGGWILEHVTPVILALANLIASMLIGQLKALFDTLNFLWPVIEFVVKGFGNLFEEASTAGNYIWDFLEPGLKAIWSILEKYVLPALQDFIEKGLKLLVTTMNGMAEILADPFNSMGAAITTTTEWLIRLWDWVVELKNKIMEIGWPEPPGWFKKLLDIGGAGVNFASMAPGTEGFASGGIVRGAGIGDSVPIMASPGELILNAAQQRNVANTMRGGGGGGGVNIYMTVTDSVITDQGAMDAFAGKVASRIASRMGSAKSLTFHRISS